MIIFYSKYICLGFEVLEAVSITLLTVVVLGLELYFYWDSIFYHLYNNRDNHTWGLYLLFPTLP